MIRVFSVIAVLILAVTAGSCSKGKAPSAGRETGGVQKAQKTGKTEAAAPKAEEKKNGTETYQYEPHGKRDPFLSIIELSKKEREAEKRKKGVRPAELFDAREIKVIAIAKDKARYYAMMELPDKKFFTVREGMAIGLYGGKVVRIDAASVVIRELIKNYRGELQPKDTVLLLRSEEGK